jgi:uncharacterized protein (TIGR02444 family)
VGEGVVDRDPCNESRDELQYDNDFWRFSLKVYDQNSVAHECLALQESHGVDVNLLLFCAWTGTRAIVLNRTEIEEASKLVAEWNDLIVRPLRSVRRNLKAYHAVDLSSFRVRVKAMEIEAEQIEQAILFAYARRFRGSGANTSCADAIAHNVNQYVTMIADGPLLSLTAPFLIEASRLLSS